ncbi:MAG: PEP-CTERM sorting domain-containing protein [Kiritimatiellales bacterium]
MKYIKYILAAAFVVASVQAALIYPSDDARFSDYGGTGTADNLDATKNNIQVTDGPNNKNLFAGAFIFELPALTADEIVSFASVQWFLRGVVGTPVSNVRIDVFFKNNGTVELSDYSATANFSVEQFLTPENAETNGKYQLSNEQLVEAINEAYENGMSHIVFRAQVDGYDNTTPASGYNFATKESDNQGMWPVLTIETIPEPGSLALLLIGLVGAFIARRKL